LPAHRHLQTLNAFLRVIEQLCSGCFSSQAAIHAEITWLTLTLEITRQLLQHLLLLLGLAVILPQWQDPEVLVCCLCASNRRLVANWLQACQGGDSSNDVLCLLMVVSLPDCMVADQLLVIVVFMSQHCSFLRWYVGSIPLLLVLVHMDYSPHFWSSLVFEHCCWLLRGRLDALHPAN